MQNYKMEIAYDGRRYKGFRKSKGDEDKTIQGKLEAILEKLYSAEVEVISAVSTDSGVHAKKQVVNFKAPDAHVNENEIVEYFETYLPDDIIVLSIEAVDERFHSRYQVKGITYEYRLWKKNAPTRPLFERHYVNVMAKRLQVSAMKEAAAILVGEHDFIAFATKSKVSNPVKTVTELTVTETESEVVIRMTANGYLLNMERIFVGTLIQIGFGERKVDSIHRAFKTRSQENVGHKAMAHALCLVDVVY